MKSFLNKFQTMTFDQLLDVNGGYGGGSGGSPSSSSGGGGYSSSTGGLTAHRYVHARERAKVLAAQEAKKNAAKGGGSSYSSPSAGYNALTSGLSAPQYVEARQKAKEREQQEAAAAEAQRQAEIAAQKQAEYEAFSEKIKDAADAAAGKYKAGTFDCDIWVQNTLKDNGIDITNLWGDAYSTNVAGHEEALEGLTTDSPGVGWRIVLMTDSDIYSVNHTGLLKVNEDGSCVLYQNSKYSPSHEDYSSVSAFESAYGYNDFDYLKVKGR